MVRFRNGTPEWMVEQLDWSAQMQSMDVYSGET